MTMPLPLIIAAATAAASIAASAIAAAIANGDHEKARAIRQQYADQYGDNMVPQLDKVVAEQVPQSAMASIQVPPEARATQADAMRKLSAIYDAGGAMPGDEAALQLANEGAAQRAASDYQSINQTLSQRGQANNPALAAALASKSGADVAHETSLNRYRAQADQRARAMQALGMSADLAGSMRGQDWNEAAAQATAADRINQFNASQRTDANMRNANLSQQEFEDLMRVRQARAAAGNGVAASWDAQGDRTAAVGQGTSNAISSFGSGAAGLYNDDGSRRK